jgi:4-hydroxy-2-oxoglutarate aldolase
VTGQGGAAGVDLTGIIAPIPTPFDAVTGDVAPVALRRAARGLLDAGLAGVAVAGSTGEGELLDDAERTQLVDWLREVVPDDRWLIAGAGAESTRGAIAIAKSVAEAGADATLVRPPAYYSATLPAQALADHYARVADESPVPLIVYNIPKYTHVMLADSVLRAVADHPNVIGFKDSSGDLKVLAGYRAAAPRLAPLVGSGHLLYAALELGAVGGVLGVSCFAPQLCVRVIEAFRAGDKETAGALQERLSPLSRAIVTDLGPAGIKAAMEATGLPMGPVRMPLLPLDARGQSRLAEALAAAGLRAAAA